MVLEVRKKGKGRIKSSEYPNTKNCKKRLQKKKFVV